MRWKATTGTVDKQTESADSWIECSEIQLAELRSENKQLLKIDGWNTIFLLEW